MIPRFHIHQVRSSLSRKMMDGLAVLKSDAMRAGRYIPPVILQHQEDEEPILPYPDLSPYLPVNFSTTAELKKAMKVIAGHTGRESHFFQNMRNEIRDPKLIGNCLFTAVEDTRTRNRGTLWQSKVFFFYWRKGDTMYFPPWWMVKSFRDWGYFDGTIPKRGELTSYVIESKYLLLGMDMPPSSSLARAKWKARQYAWGTAFQNGLVKKVPSEYRI